MKNLQAFLALDYENYPTGLSINKLKTALKEFKGNVYFDIIGTKKVKFEDVDERQIQQSSLRN
jgi:hypothetical protein